MVRAQFLILHQEERSPRILEDLLPQLLGKKKKISGPTQNKVELLWVLCGSVQSS